MGTDGHHHHEHHDHGHHAHGAHEPRRHGNGGNGDGSIPAGFEPGERVLTLRSHSGLSGDMFLAGLVCMTGLGQEELDDILAGLMPELRGAARLVRREVHHVGGWHAEVRLPHQHEHRTLSEVAEIIDRSALSPEGKRRSAACFRLLAEAEGFVHGKPAEAVHFHEVGALDSILDICLSCELFARLAPAHFVASPLPVADGMVMCAHGVIPVPAPAVLELLPGIPVRSFAGEGETVTPTGAALLRALDAGFGPWPPMSVERTALVYGTRVFPNVANGATFASGVIHPH